MVVNNTDWEGKWTACTLTGNMFKQSGASLLEEEIFCSPMPHPLQSLWPEKMVSEACSAFSYSAVSSIVVCQQSKQIRGPADTTAAPAQRQVFTDDCNQSQDQKDRLCVILRVSQMLLTSPNMRISQGLSYVSLVLRLLRRAHKDVWKKHVYEPKSLSWPPSSQYPPLDSCLWAGRAACIFMASPM